MRPGSISLRSGSSNRMLGEERADFEAQIKRARADGLAEGLAKVLAKGLAKGRAL